MRHQLGNPAHLLNDALQTLCLTGRQNQLHELVEADALVLSLEHVFGIQGEFQDAPARVLSLRLPLLNLKRDLAERILHGPEVSLQLSQDRKSTRLNSSHTVISYA